MSKLRIGIVGCGNIAGCHARAYTKLDGIELAAFCDIEEQKAARFVEQYSGRAFADVEAMLKADRLDAVSVATTPTAHRGPAIAALKRGVPVLCEKPLAPSVADGAAMVQAAEQSKAMLMTGYPYRFRVEPMTAKEWLKGGVIGQPLFAHNSFSGQWLGVVDSWFVQPAISGGGIVLDNGSHSIDLFHYLFGNVRQVHASLSRVNSGIEVEDTALILTEHDSGVSGSIELSWSVPRSHDWYLEIYGTQGTIKIRFGEARYITAASDEWQTRPGCTDFQEGFDRMIAHFVQCLRTGTPPSPSGRDGLRAIEVIEQIYRQAPPKITGRATAGASSVSRGNADEAVAH
jgi:predicted dehydrogenase